MTLKLGSQLKFGSGSGAEEGFGSTRSQVRILSPRLTFHRLAFKGGPQKGPQNRTAGAPPPTQAAVTSQHPPLSPQQQVAILPGQSGADERRTASEPCCAGTGDGAGGSAVVGLDPDAEMIAALLPPYPSSPLLPEPRRQQLEQIRVMNKMKRANWIENFSSNLHN